MYAGNRLTKEPTHAVGTIPKSIPTTFGFGGGKYCWAKYPAKRNANTAPPVTQAEHITVMNLLNLTTASL